MKLYIASIFFHNQLWFVAIFIWNCGFSIFFLFSGFFSLVTLIRTSLYYSSLVALRWECQIQIPLYGLVVFGRSEQWRETTGCIFDGATHCNLFACKSQSCQLRKVHLWLLNLSNHHHLCNSSARLPCRSPTAEMMYWVGQKRFSQRISTGSLRLFGESTLDKFVTKLPSRIFFSI